MNIELMQNNCIKIKLSKEDLKGLDIALEDLDYSNIETRRVIWTLLDVARYELQIDINPSEKMIIEVMPNQSGGCCIYINGVDNYNKTYKFNIKKSIKSMFFDFDDWDFLIDGINSIKKIVDCSSQLSEIYRLSDEKFRLIVYPDKENALALTAVFSEYATSYGTSNLAIAYTREHSRLIVGGDAIGAIIGK